MALDTDTDGRKNALAAYVDRRLVVGSAALMTGGLLVWLAGAAAGTAALLRAFQRYVADLDEPPRESARRRLGQVKSATAAGVGAWQDYSRPASSPDS